MRERDKAVLMASLALGHHVGEAVLDRMEAPRKVRLFWDGIGVGWAGFWFLMVLLGEAKAMHEAKYKPPYGTIDI